jgi:hypothetical protein
MLFGGKIKSFVLKIYAGFDPVLLFGYMDKLARMKNVWST